MAIIGTHISAAGGLDKVFARADALRCEALQLFTRSARQWLHKPVSFTEAQDFYSAWKSSRVKRVVCHSSYLINLATADAEIRKKSIQALTDEAERCHQLGINDIVVHPGFAMGLSEDEAIKNVAEALLEVFSKTPEYTARILLETMAGQGTVIGVSFAQLGNILKAVSFPARLGICIDTSHVFAAGYDLRTAEAYERFVDAAERHVGTESVGCWHLNDNIGEKGKNLDRHTHIGQGQIGPEPFIQLMNDERFSDTPTILETPKEFSELSAAVVRVKLKNRETDRYDEMNLSFLRKVRGQ